MAAVTTRAEHLAWCKQRALEYADRGELTNAISSMTSDLAKHPDTAGHSGIELMHMEAMAGFLRTRADARRCIEGFQ